MKWPFQYREAVWAFGLAFLMVFGFMPGLLMDAGWLPKLLILALLSSVLLVWGVFSKKQLSSFGLWLVLIVWFVSLIPSLLQSDNTGDAWMVIARSGLLMALASSFLMIPRSVSLKNMVFFFALSTLALSAVWGWIELLMSMEGFSVTHKATYEVVASFGHRNVFVQFLCLVIPFTLIGITFNGKVKITTVFTLMMALVLAVLLLNRTAWVAVLITCAGLLIHDYKTKEISHHLGVSLSKVMSFVAVITAGLLMVLVDELYTLWHHVEMTMSFDSGTTRDRLLLVERSFELFKTAPFFGVGLGMWKILIMSFPQDEMLTESARVFYQRPHNDYLWILSESGIIAGLMYIGLHTYGAFKAVQMYRYESNLWHLALVLTWLVFIINSITIFPIERPESLLVLALLLALTFTQDSEFSASIKNRKYGQTPLYIALVIGIICAVFFTMRLKSELTYYSAREYRKIGDWEQFKNQLESIDQSVLTVDQVSAPIEYYLGVSHYLLGDKDQAFNAFKEAITINPYHPEIWNNLGLIYAERADEDSAFYSFENAVRNTKSYQEAWLNIAVMQYQTGKWREAFISYQKADSTGSSKLYEQLGTRLAIDSLNQLLDQTENRKMYSTLEAFRNTPEWSYNIIVKSAVNEISFDHQAYLDACYYMLKNCELYEDCELVDSVIEKYLPQGKQELNLNQEN